MKTFYRTLSPGQKRSLVFSMRTLIKEYMDGYNWRVESFKTREVMISDLYFYWLRNSADRRYLWCENLNDRVFSERFAREMKKKIKEIYHSIDSVHNSL